MGLMRWMRGGEENSQSTSAISAGLAEIDGIFRPSKHKQTEFIAESKRKRVDFANGSDVDLDSGTAVIRSVKPKPSAASTAERSKRVYTPRRQNLWKRVQTSMHRRKVARAKARTTKTTP